MVQLFEAIQSEDPCLQIGQQNAQRPYKVRVTRHEALRILLPLLQQVFDLRNLIMNQEEQFNIINDGNIKY
jgi:hypothetical protein